MRIFYLFSLSLFCINVHEQTNIYHPFPQLQAVWKWEEQSMSGTVYYETTLGGDTTINALPYKKMYHDGQYAGGMRQEISNESVFFIDLQDIEQDISIQQNASLNDTIYLSPSIYNAMFHREFTSGDSVFVAQIDSVLVGSNYRTSYLLKPINSNWTIYKEITYISGVGLNAPLILNVGFGITCFIDNGTFLYGETGNPSCNPFWGTEEFRNEFGLDIFPNPTTSQLYITLAGNKKANSYTIFNSLGKAVITGQMKSSEQTIDVSGLSKGIY